MAVTKTTLFFSALSVGAMRLVELLSPKTIQTVG